MDKIQNLLDLIKEETEASDLFIMLAKESIYKRESSCLSRVRVHQSALARLRQTPNLSLVKSFLLDSDSLSRVKVGDSIRFSCVSVGYLTAGKDYIVLSTSSSSAWDDGCPVLIKDDDNETEWFGSEFGPVYVTSVI